jgi:hypothetical protein
MADRARSLRAVLCALTTVILGASTTPAHAQGQHHRIIIVTGQSNARSQFADGFIDGIELSGAMPDARLFHRHHSGNWMNRWVTGEAGSHELAENFLNDFWNPAGTSALQQEIAAIEAAGDTWELDGFLWFQGEGDSGSPYNRGQYRSRFEHMIRVLEAAYELRRDLRVVLTEIDFNGDADALFEIGGRTPDDIEAMRAIQREIADADPTFETVDSRGWPRFDVWHIGDFDDPRGLYGLAGDFGASPGAGLSRHHAGAQPSGSQRGRPARPRRSERVRFRVPRRRPAERPRDARGRLRSRRYLSVHRPVHQSLIPFIGIRYGGLVEPATMRTPRWSSEAAD